MDPLPVGLHWPGGSIASHPLRLPDLPGSLLHPETEMLTLNRQYFLISVVAAQAAYHCPYTILVF